MISGQKQRTTWLHGAAMLTIWWPVLTFVCYSIFIRIQAKYFAGLLVASGIDGSPSVSDVLFLYRQDLLILGVAVPLLTAWCFVKLRFALAAALSGLAVLLMQILLYANIQSWGQVGSFMTWQSLRNAIAFGLSKPEFVGEYIALDGVAKLSVLIAASALVLIAGHRLRRHRGLIRLWGWSGLLSVALCAGLTGYGYTSGMRAVPISGSFAGNALAAMLDTGNPAGNPPPAAQLGDRYARLANLSQAPFSGPNADKHRGSNLLLFVMETASIEFLDTRKGQPGHPALDALKGKIYVAANHYSTFPASAEGNLSILTGTYPPRAIYGTCLIDVPRTGGRLPGPIGELRKAGYKTGVYAPYRSQVPADKVVFEATGFEQVVYGETLAGAGNADKRAFDRLSQDIAKWGAAGQPFAAAFLPQIGHGPWPTSLGKTIPERGTRIVREQLDWLGQIVESLRATGQLDNTVIVVTGDHGVRTSIEDPRVKVGMIDWYSFHVPLLIYAPRASYAGIDPALPSSHVDLSAELTELFGLPPLPSYQGLALHHPDRAQRRGFLMAGWYFGANGYRDTGEAAMYSDLLDTVYARPRGTVDFGSGNIVTEPRRRAAIRERLSGMAALQEAWIAERVCPRPGA